MKRSAGGLLRLQREVQRMATRAPLYPRAPTQARALSAYVRSASAQPDVVERFAAAARAFNSTKPGPGKSGTEKEVTGDGTKAEAKGDAKAGEKKADGEKDGSDNKQKSGAGPQGGAAPGWGSQAAMFLVILTALSYASSRGNGTEISFQSFVRSLLAKGLVERIEVVNRTTARVYLKPGVRPPSLTTGLSAEEARAGMNAGSVDGSGGSAGAFDASGSTGEFGGERDWSTDGGDSALAGSSDASASGTTRQRQLQTGEAQYYFSIGTVDSFDRKLQTIQEDLGILPEDFIDVSYVNETNIMAEIFRNLPSLALLGVGAIMLRNAMGAAGAGGRGGMFQVGKSPATVVKKGDKNLKLSTFKDVAGLNEAKTEIMEFVDFLKNPARYEKLGAKIPKGALLSGPPGCGKTLLAKATAGEANVPFYSISGSDFIEMFVGVGPSRVRDLFATARANAPCIIFIDEIDAVGRARGRSGMGGGNDERENTLNALLVEMDGFTSSTGVVVLAGTNRVDVLDRALLRPGRFDRQISVDKPDMRGRFEIFMVHLKPLKLTIDPVSIAKRLAALTPGFGGADIANVCNEAALIAAREDKTSVELSDFERATDRVIGGLEKKNKVISRREREIVAHHEAGHAVTGWFLKHADPLVKVSIIPRGSAALGFAQYLPVDKFLQSRQQMDDFMIMALGGRVAEQLCFGSITTGAQDDLNRITRAVYAQVTNFGMSERVGKMNFPRPGQPGSGSQFYKPYSESTAEMIDEEAVRIVDEAYVSCEKLLTEKLDIVKALAARLLEKEVLNEDELIEIMGPRPFSKPADYDSVVKRFDNDRRKRTGQGEESDAAARDGATTPPIPVEGSESEAAPGSAGPRQPRRHEPADEWIPELA
jgi:AFG3 family protein